MEKESLAERSAIVERREREEEARTLRLKAEQDEAEAALVKAVGAHGERTKALHLKERNVDAQLDALQERVRIDFNPASLPSFWRFCGGGGGAFMTIIEAGSYFTAIFTNSSANPFKGR